MVAERKMHFVLTRYNVGDPRFPPAALDLALNHDWLSHRTELFEKVCAPSVNAQSSAEFTWLIFLHPETPRSIEERIRIAAPSAVQVRSEWGTAASAQEAIAPLLLASTKWVITSRLDNDDALARDFIQVVAAGASALTTKVCAGASCCS